MSLWREVTDNLAEGIGRSRWGDDEATLRVLHPEAYFRHMPGVGAPLIVPNLVEGAGPVRLKGYFFLGPRGVEYVVLSEDAEDDDVDVLPCVHALAHRFGFGPITDSKRQVWVVHGVQVLLQLFAPHEEGGPLSEFHLRVNHPGVIQNDFRIFEVPVSVKVDVA
ncbi:hypothetical protein [Myxococcus stipitatus]|uniref:hypothetical protein n=1 Tax=Myxococcus stipitatus TaxID=83455 RepID=UPI0030CAF22F